MMARVVLRKLWVGIVAGCVLVAVGGAGPAPEPTTSAHNAKPTRYVDSKSRFSLIVPAGAEVVEQGEPLRLQIASPKGYRISLQTGRADASSSLADMTGRLEEQYLGSSGPWTRKLSQRAATVGGLPALETVYDGSRQRSRVLIMRGRDTDFVMVFSGAPGTFDALTQEFEAILTSFQPGPRELAAAAPNTAKTAAAPPRPSPSARQQFVDDALGFALEIPQDWTVERPSPFTVVFSGEPGQNAYFTTVSIQNIDGSSLPDAGKRVGRVLADLRSGLDRRAKDVRFVGDATYAYDHHGIHLDGRQVLIDYVFQGQRFRQWTLVVPRSTDGVVHVWSYTAPSAQFDASRSAAETMLRSWVLNDPRPGRS